MQRSKQNALMFVLGAVLVGGVLGFSAARIGHWADTKDFHDRSTNMREYLYRDLGLTEEQRTRWEALTDSSMKLQEAIRAPLRPRLDSLESLRDSLFGTIRPQLDSVRSGIRAEVGRLLTPDQQQKYEMRQKEWRTRDSIERARNPRGPRRGPPPPSPRYP